MRKKKYLIAVTASFPYGLKEPFLETELKYLSEHFDKIFLLVPKISKTQSHHINYEIPDNALIVQFDFSIGFWERLFSVRYLFGLSFWKEIHIIKKHYQLKLNRRIITTILSTLTRSEHFAKQIKKFVKANRIPLKQTTCYTYWCNEYTLGIGNLRKKYKIAGAFSRIHNWDLYFERATDHYLPLRSKMFRYLDVLFPVSAQTKNYITKKIPYLDPDKLIVSYLGVDNTNNFIPSQKNKKLRILSLSFLGKIKRIDLLVAALEQLEGFEVEWHHIGEGNDHLNLKQHAFNRLFNKENITYHLTGDFTKKQVYDYLQKEYFDVLINTSSYEGVPVSMMEAMSFSIPVIGTNVGGVAEIIEHQKNGYLMSANPEPAEINEYLLKIQLMDETAYRQMRQYAYNTWQEKFNAQSNYTDFIYSMVQFSRSHS